jgi:hemolysin D
VTEMQAVITDSNAQPSVAIRIRSALFEIAAHEPEQAPRIVLWTIAALCALLLVWAIFAKLDIVAVAEGRLVPQTYVKIIQPSDAGIVREILVHEGDHVAEGQVLARLDQTENSADRAAVSRELAIQHLQIRRVDAELHGASLRKDEGDDLQLFLQAQAQGSAHRQQFLDSVGQESASRERAEKDLRAATEVMRKLEKTLPSYQRSADAYTELEGRQLVGALEAEEKRRDALEKSQDLESQRATVAGLQAAVAQSDRRMAELKSGYESDLRNTRLEAVGKITQLEQEKAKLQFRHEHLELRAPQSGVIKELATTTLGAVVQPGTVLLTLVPVDEPLMAEVSIQNEDIGFVRAGQAVRIKLATYPFQKYGMLDGVVRTVIADSKSQDQNQNQSQSRAKLQTERADSGAANSLLSFKAMVELREQQLRAEHSQFPLAAGMQLSAEIVEGSRTVAQYLLSPVQRVSHEAAMER